jgi:hypothetical protein
VTERNIIILLVFAYILGVGGGWGYFIKTKPSEDQRLQFQVDQEIRDDLCDRIHADIKKFEEYPQTFKRSSLRVLISESTISTRTIFSDQNESKTIKFRGIDGKKITSTCEKAAQRWVKIPSVFPQFFEQELALVDEHSKIKNIDISSPISKQMYVNNGKRLALVIGNSAYENRPLKNPVNDAKDISAVLKKLDFKVIEIYDVDLIEMRSAVKSFTDSLSQFDVGLVYYSGHGIEFAGRNYFIPINADIKNEDEIPRQGLDASEIVEKLGRNNLKTTIFIIDACRNAPVFSSFKSPKAGLSVMHGSIGGVIAYSAAPGQVALDGNERNSPYTSELLRQIQIPNKKIEDIFKDTAKVVYDKTAGRQLPWYNSGIVGEFYFLKSN